MNKPSHNLNDLVNGIVIKKSCSIKPDGDSDESKIINLEISYNAVTLGAVFQKASSSAVITWQNGPGRKKWASWKNGQIVKINFTSPASTQIDPEQYMVSKLATMSPSERDEYLAELLASAESNE